MSDSDVVVFEELPAQVLGRSRHAGKWVTRLAPLVGRPGEWARVASFQGEGVNAAHALARNLRDRRVQVPEGEWEFTSRTVEGETRVYARFLGAGAGAE